MVSASRDAALLHVGPDVLEPFGCTVMVCAEPFVEGNIRLSIVALEVAMVELMKKVTNGEPIFRLGARGDLLEPRM